MDAKDLAQKAVQHGAVQKQRELELLMEELDFSGFRNVLEIGTEAGGTLWLWCQLVASDATIISVDLQNAQGYTQDDVPRILTYTRDQQTLMLFRENSHLNSTLLSVERVLKGEPLDFLFIDGDHSYEGVRCDWEMYSPLVKRGGVVVFHDIAERQLADNCEVRRLWHELKQDYRTSEIKLDDDWGGFGVVYMD